VTTLWTERLALHTAPEPGLRTRDDRVVAFARELADDALAGRTVWFAAGLPRGREAADALRRRLAPAPAEGSAANPLAIAADEPLRGLAQQLDGMLAGAPVSTRLGSAARAALSEQTRSSETHVERDVGQGDVVVLHDALTAVLADAIRERGAHAVWLVDAGHFGAPAAREAFDFLRQYTTGVDAYVVSWSELMSDGGRLEHVAALMPSAGIVEMKEVVVGGPRRPGLGWSSALADVVAEDRDEHVGGRLHPRPAVAVR
jgi:hypothetical protein